jgi:hypothetical protein
MPSKAITSLDVWLARAEEVLVEQRHHALSPSLGLLEDVGNLEWTTTLAALSEGLEGLLESLCRRPGRWVLIVEADRRRHQFWQALAFEDGSLVTETVSNHYLPDEHHWTRHQEERLLALGWAWLIRPHLTNWIHVEPTTSPVIGPIVEKARSTLREVFGLSDHDLVFVKLFSSALRGDTPASPQYTTEEDATPIPDADLREHAIDKQGAADDHSRIGRSQVARRYVRPNPEWSDDELDAWAERWLDQIVGA